jgi:hypothetical protein
MKKIHMNHPEQKKKNEIEKKEKKEFEKKIFI